MARAHSTARVAACGQRHRHAEDRHEAVAQVFVQGPLVLEDQVHHLGEEDVEHLHHLLPGPWARPWR